MNQKMVDEVIEFIKSHKDLINTESGEVIYRAFINKILSSASELLRENRTSVRLDGNKLKIVSGDYGLLAKRKASNSYEISLLTSEEYDEQVLQNKS